MSERERWVVYPLLFLTLGLALRDELGLSRKIATQKVVCSQLVVQNDKGDSQVVLDATEDGGVVRVLNAKHTMDLVLGHENNYSSLFRETASKGGVETRALLGDLRPSPASSMPESVGNWPLLDPRLNRTGRTDSDSNSDDGATDPADVKPAPRSQQ